MKFHVPRHLCRIARETRSDDFSRPFAVKATEVATTLLRMESL